MGCVSRQLDNVAEGVMVQPIRVIGKEDLLNRRQRPGLAIMHRYVVSGHLLLDGLASLSKLSDSLELQDISDSNENIL
jgi:hypothetical protein